MVFENLNVPLHRDHNASPCYSHRPTRTTRTGAAEKEETIRCTKMSKWG